MSVPRLNPRMPTAAQEVVAQRRRVDRLEAAAPMRVGTIDADLGSGQVTVDVSVAQDGSQTVDANVAPAGASVAVDDVVIVIPLPRAVGSLRWVAVTMGTASGTAAAGTPGATTVTIPTQAAPSVYGSARYGLSTYDVDPEAFYGTSRYGGVDTYV